MERIEIKWRSFFSLIYFLLSFIHHLWRFILLSSPKCNLSPSTATISSPWSCRNASSFWIWVRYQFWILLKLDLSSSISFTTNAPLHHLHRPPCNPYSHLTHFIMDSWLSHASLWFSREGAWIPRVTILPLLLRVFWLGLYVILPSFCSLCCGYVVLFMHLLRISVCVLFVGLNLLVFYDHLCWFRFFVYGVCYP